jgi:hypothetical protein
MMPCMDLYFRNSFAPTLLFLFTNDKVLLYRMSGQESRKFSTTTYQTTLSLKRLGRWETMLFL